MDISATVINTHKRTKTTQMFTTLQSQLLCLNAYICYHATRNLCQNTLGLIHTEGLG